MADPLFKKALEKAKGTWAGAKKRAETEGFASDIEDGRYLARISKADLGMSKTSSRLQVAWTYLILDGEFNGKTKMDWDGADTEDNQMWLGRKLARLGFEIPADLDEVLTILKQVVDDKLVVRITVKTKGEFQKVYVDEVVDPASLEGIDLGTQDKATEFKPEELETALEVGATVSFTYKNEEVQGKVLEVLEAEGKVRIKTDKGVFKLPPDSLTLVEEVPEEPEVEPEVEAEPEPEEEKSSKKAPAKKVVKKGRR